MFLREERCVGTLGDGDGGPASGRQGCLDAAGEAVRGADSAKIGWEHETLYHGRQCIYLVYREVRTRTHS
jgi:hypothetical protein